MMLPFVSESALHRLRLWWLGFGSLAGLSGLYWLIGQLVKHGTVYMHGHLYMAERQVCLFALLLLSSYSKRQSAWWLAIGIISWKLWRLWRFYFGRYGVSSSIDFYHEFWGTLHLLPNSSKVLIYSLLGGVDPVSVALYSFLYGYWLLICLRVLRHLPGNQSLQ